MNKQIQNMTFFKRSVIASALLVAMSQASAVTFNLCTGTTTKTMPDGTVVTMWGYGDDSTGTCTVTVPGPQLIVPPGDTTLVVNLRNTLPEASSVMIPGLVGNSVPNPASADDFFTDINGNRRAKSMVASASAAGGVQTYTFTAKPGTYLYQSGTHAAVQVQMGLYGAATADSAVGEAYPGVSYDNEVVLMYSEIDPALHNAVRLNQYGPGTAMPSTINYKPRYFLVNGEAYTPASADIPAGAAGQRTLLRMLNAGIESHFPTMVGTTMSFVAEYGNQYPYARDQFSSLMAAGMTKDAILTPKTDGRLALFDRHLRLTNAAATPGGLMTFLSVGAAVPPGNSAPVGGADAFTVVAGSTLTVAAPGVLANDTDADGDALTAVLATGPANAAAFTLNADGSFSYTPNAGATSDSFTYMANDGTVNSAPVTVTITVDPVPNTAPVAVNDSGYTVTEGSILSVAAAGVLANDTDADGNALTAVLVTSPTGGSVTLNADGSFSYTPNAGTTTDSFTYMANDGLANSNVATVSITVTPLNAAPVTADDAYSVTEGTTLTVAAPGVLANDTDANGDALTATLTTSPVGGTLIFNANGSFSFTPTITGAGTSSFTYVANDGKVNSAPATVTITVNAAVNVAPVAVDDAGDVVKNTRTTNPKNSVTINLIANDTDVNNNIDPASIQIRSNPRKGTVVVNGDGTVTYTPKNGSTGSDSFSYRVYDLGGLRSNTATVRINIL